MKTLNQYKIEAALIADIIEEASKLDIKPQYAIGSSIPRAFCKRK